MFSGDVRGAMLVRQFLRRSSDLPSVAVRLAKADLAAQPAPPPAIELIAQQPVKMVEGRKVYCDGLDTASLGHPRVYINLDDVSNSAVCKYCGLRFQQKHHEHH